MQQKYRTEATSDFNQSGDDPFDSAVITESAQAPPLQFSVLTKREQRRPIFSHKLMDRKTFLCADNIEGTMMGLKGSKKQLWEWV